MRLWYHDGSVVRQNGQRRRLREDRMGLHDKQRHLFRTLLFSSLVIVQIWFSMTTCTTPRVDRYQHPSVIGIPSVQAFVTTTITTKSTSFLSLRSSTRKTTTTAFLIPCSRVVSQSSHRPTPTATRVIHHDEANSIMERQRRSLFILKGKIQDFDNEDDDEDDLTTTTPAARPSTSTTRRTTTSRSPERERRTVLIQTTAALLSSYILQTVGPAVSNAVEVNSNSNESQLSAGTTSAVVSPSPLLIVLTGANSGIGYEACKQLALHSHVTVVMACRTYERSVQAIQRMNDEMNMESSTSTSSSPLIQAQLIPAECNLASQQSIRQFVSNTMEPLLLNDKQSKKNIDVVAYNAGIARNVNSEDCLRTDDGFELTIGTNHFGHFYLNHLLLPHLKGYSTGNAGEKNMGKIIVTASSVHDPNSPGGAQGELATLGQLQGLEQDGIKCEMIDGQKFNADKAYKDSKLCNVLFTRELQRRLDLSQKQSIIVNCFTPGLIVGTGLFRDQNPIFTKVFDFAATKLLKVGESPAYGGQALMYMINQVNETRGAYYYSPPGTSAKYGDKAFQTSSNSVEKDPFPIFRPAEVSIEAQDNDKARRLWELSEQLLNIKTVV